MSEKLSRSEQKRQFKKLESLAKELSELPDQQLQKVSISEDLQDEIALLKKTKAGAKKRQLKYITKLLQYEAIDDLFRHLQETKGSKLDEDRLHHEAERWRDAIVNDAIQAFEDYRAIQLEWDLGWESPALDNILTQLPEIDAHEIRRSAHQYARIRNKRHYRELFRIIKAALEKQRLKKRHTRHE